MAMTPRDWRQGMIGAGWISLLAGIWLMASPDVLDYGSGDDSWNPILVGAIIVILAAVRLGAGPYRGSWAGWAEIGAGAWLFVSGIWLPESTDATWNAIAMGVLVAFLGIVGLASVESRRSTTL
jgi:hypothetical protein